MRKQNLNLDLKGKEKRKSWAGGMCVREMFQAKGTAHVKASK